MYHQIYTDVYSHNKVYPCACFTETTPLVHVTLYQLFEWLLTGIVP